MKRARYNPPMSRTKCFLNNLARLRDAGEICVNDIAEKTGLHRVTVSTIVNGHSKAVTLEAAAQIAEAVNIPLSDLISRKIDVTANSA